MSQLRQIILRPDKRGGHRGHHPWILASSIIEPASTPRVGEIVDIVTADGKWIGRGLYNSNSRIRVRVYTWTQDQPIDDAFFTGRVEQAIELRGRIAKFGQYQAMRIVFSEADRLSGLVVDKYDEHLVVQLTAAALRPYLDAIIHQLTRHYRPLSISVSIDERTAASEGVEAEHWFAVGTEPSEPISIEENGLKWQVDLNGGQKTGYYLDQRDNRVAAARWTPTHARVLDVCTYVGGFALHIAKHSNTREIIAIDSSAKALATAREHAQLNGLGERVQWVQDDFFHALSSRVDAKESFDMIVLDPPRLASSRDHLQRALSAYHRLNYLAVRLLRPGGILVTCSCSGRVSRVDFRDMLMGVANRANREIQVVENRAAAADHPVSISCPETDYLKCMIARVV